MPWTERSAGLGGCDRDQAVVDAACAEHAGIIVGGQGLTTELQHRLVVAAVGTRLAHLKELARTLAP